MANDPKKFHLKVTAGPSYAPSTHKVVPVNTSTPLEIKSEHITASLAVRIQNYRGLPAESPPTCAYFEQAPHTNDLYSISFRFKLPPSADPIPGTDLLFGNDFDQPIRDRLPPGFGAALKFVKWAIDPGLDGDVHADKPYLYGPLLSSINVLSIGDKDKNGDDEEPDADALPEAALAEGATRTGAAVRDEQSIPAASPQRMKHFLTDAHRQAFTFEPGRAYDCDFFNAYLDFNDLALRLPVATLHLMRFWDGQPLRYTLKQRSKDGSVDRELLVVVFSLVPAEEAESEAAHEAQGQEEPEHEAKEPQQKPDQASEAKYVDEGVD